MRAQAFPTLSKPILILIAWTIVFAIPSFILLKQDVEKFYTLTMLFPVTVYIWLQTRESLLLRLVLMIVPVSLVPIEDDFYVLHLQDIVGLFIGILLILHLLGGDPLKIVITKFFILVTIFIMLYLIALFRIEQFGRIAYLFKPILWYSAAFLSFSFLNENKIRLLVIVLFTSTVAVFLEYLMNIGGVFSAFTRYTMSKGTFFSVGYNLAFALFLYATTRKQKIIYAILTFIFILGLYLTLNRGLWISGMAVTLLLILIRFSHTKYFKTMLRLIFICFLLLLFLYFAMSLFAQEKTSGSQRLETIQEMTSDASLFMRFDAASQIYDMTLKKNILFGMGFNGSVVYRVFEEEMTIYHMDNSYINVFWRTGILGLVIFLLVYAAFYWEALWLIRLESDMFIRVFTIAVIGIITQMLIYSLVAPMLDAYKYIAVLSLMMGIVSAHYAKHNYFKTKNASP